MLEPIETTDYGLKRWEGVPIPCREKLMDLANDQGYRNIRYCLEGYSATRRTTEPMRQAPPVLAELVEFLVESGIIDEDWANTARVKWYDQSTYTQAKYPHVDPWFYLEGDYLVFCSLSSRAILSVERPDGEWDTFDCTAGTIIVFPSRCKHMVSSPLDPERRVMVFLGQDETMEQE
jgi:hypothetical protein